MHALHIAADRLRDDITAPDDITAGIVGTVVILAILGWLGRTVFHWGTKFDNVLWMLAALIGIAGPLSMSRFVQPIGDGIRAAVEGIVGNIPPLAQYGREGYTIVVVVIAGIALLILNKRRGDSDGGQSGNRSAIGPVLVVAALGVPFFANGIGADLMAWYMNNIAINVYNGLAWFLNWFI